MNVNLKFVALLGGINVGGNHKVPMVELRKEMGNLGFENVHTLLNSGNVIFDTSLSEEKLEDMIASGLGKAFGFPIPVLVRKSDEIQDLIKNNPFKQVHVTKDTRLYISILKVSPEKDLTLPFTSTDGSFKILEIRGKAAFSVLDLAITNTPKGMDALEALFGKNITTRNWNTINPKISKVMETSYLSSVIKQFEYYKMLGEKAMVQVPDEALFWQYNEESNSIAVIVNHVVGNMLSRFTDFLTTDGEKPWRNRDAEFKTKFSTREELVSYWNEGWDRLLKTLNSLTEVKLNDIVYIRNEGHTVVEAINRQLAHYPYHIGQIIYIAKMVVGEKWESLSIPRDKSNDYNARKFAQEKSRRHFTDGL